MFALKMVLFAASHGNTYVGGKCALLSALLVKLINMVSVHWFLSQCQLYQSDETMIQANRPQTGHSVP